MRCVVEIAPRIPTGNNDWLRTAGIVRCAHLLPFPLPGGERAVAEPRRAALALLWQACGEEGAFAASQAAQGRGQDLSPLAELLRRGTAGPTTTSMGRLFDGMASITGLCQQASFEGQGGTALELAAERYERTAGRHHMDAAPRYSIPLLNAPTPADAHVADWRPLVSAAYRDAVQGIDPGLVAYEFHAALADLILRVAQMAGLFRVVLSGGCFQNSLLVRMSGRRLESGGFAVYTHRQVPPNDGGLSLGQALIAAHRIAAQENG